MSVRREFERRIEKKRQEISEMEKALGEAKAYLQALQDSLKFLPRDLTGQADSDYALRPGSDMAKVRGILKTAAKPLYIEKILELLGKEKNKKNRLSVAGSLSAYVREGKIFTKPAPNTFGLVELDQSGEPPEDFGEDLGAKDVPAMRKA